MEWFKSLPMAAVAIIVGIVSAVAWVVLDGTVPLVVSIVAGGLIALRAVLGDADSDPN